MARTQIATLLLILILSLAGKVRSQEINSRVTVLYNQVATTVDRKVFQTLQTSITSFINKRKWTTDAFEAGERIDCSFLINLTGIKEPNVYQATLSVQAARPVYNTSYLSPLVNFQDNDLVFRYVEFQPLEFNDNRVSGSEPAGRQPDRGACLLHLYHTRAGLRFLLAQGGRPVLPESD